MGRDSLATGFMTTVHYPGRTVSSRHYDHSSSGTYPALHETGTEGSLPEDKATGG